MTGIVRRVLGGYAGEVRPAPGATEVTAAPVPAFPGPGGTTLPASSESFPGDLAINTSAQAQRQAPIATHPFIADRWARGIFEHDPDAVAKARAEWFAWNLRNPDNRIRIMPWQIQRRVGEMALTREQRFVRAAPVALRPAVATELKQ